MALLPPKALDIVVAIGSKVDDDETQWIGTGFIYGFRDAESGGEVYPFLVTNAHVLADDDIIVIKMNRADALPANEYAVNLEGNRDRITVHPDGLDVAALPMPAEFWNVDQVSTSAVFEADSLTPEKAGEIGVSEGDGVFAIGFPLGLVGYEDQLFPIVKQGCIARIRDWLSGRTRHILIDANIFPGNSGGPIFLRPSVIAIGGRRANPTPYLIGMASGYIPYEDTAASLQTGRERVIFEENSGIVEVVPSDAIMETVQLAMRVLQEGPGNVR